MKKYIPVGDWVKEVRSKRITQWIDKISFVHILMLWIMIILSFGLLYHFAIDNSNHLAYQDGNITRSPTDSIYFSFVTATTTGFGDILPIGLFKVIAIVEVIVGMLLLALVTSKLVSIKQDVILNEIYELSFNEKINNLRSSLILFKQNIDHVAMKVEDGTIKKRELNQLHILYFSSFEHILHEIDYFIGKTGTNHFVKRIDPVRIELILGSIITAFEKLDELFGLLDSKGLEWRRDITINLLNSCIDLADSIFGNVSKSQQLSVQKFNELNSRKSFEIIRLEEIMLKKSE
ncbi:two pore domain potassium channel family protein [Candidatus Woesearchaeota archaeon]|nr:two pore domain potassium channel family protein [Candidatus Woesearchaeota archaeon]